MDHFVELSQFHKTLFFRLQRVSNMGVNDSEKGLVEITKLKKSSIVEPENICTSNFCYLRVPKTSSQSFEKVWELWNNLSDHNLD